MQRKLLRTMERTSIRQQRLALARAQLIRVVSAPPSPASALTPTSAAAAATSASAAAMAMGATTPSPYYHEPYSAHTQTHYMAADDEEHELLMAAGHLTPSSSDLDSGRSEAGGGVVSIRIEPPSPSPSSSSLLPASPLPLPPHTSGLKGVSRHIMGVASGERRHSHNLPPPPTSASVLRAVGGELERRARAVWLFARLSAVRLWRAVAPAPALSSSAVALELERDVMRERGRALSMGRGVQPMYVLGQGMCGCVNHRPLSA
jgi:hypothetical protein